MPGDASLAKQYRAHRAAFELALELGCTPRQASQILRDRERKRRRTCGTQAPVAPTEDDFEPLERQRMSFLDDDCPWMMRK